MTKKIDWSTKVVCLGPCGRELRKIGSPDDGRIQHYGQQKCVKCRGFEIRRAKGIPEQVRVWFNDTHQECRRCLRIRPLEKFGPKPAALSGRQSVCNSCFNLKYQYGLTFTDYLEIYNRQDSGCGICKEKHTINDDTDLTLHVDHNHITGRVRGLLCLPCNSSLGMFKESEELITSAVRYLSKDRVVLPSYEIEPVAPKFGMKFCEYCLEYRENSKFSNGSLKCRRCRHIYSRYGIFFYQREYLRLLQNNSCAICLDESKKLHIDHDHGCCESGSKGCGKCVRGLLCSKCNHGIGHAKESEEIFDEMVSYIRKYTI